MMQGGSENNIMEKWASVSCDENHIVHKNSPNNVLTDDDTEWVGSPDKEEIRFDITLDRPMRKVFQSIEIHWTRPAKSFEVWCYAYETNKWWMAGKEEKNSKNKWKKNLKQFFCGKVRLLMKEMYKKKCF